MQLKATTDAKATVDLKNTVEIQPANFKLGPMGKVFLSLPQLKIRIPDIKIKVWFFPFLRIGGLNIETEAGQLEVNLGETVINGRIDATSVQVGGEVNTRIEA
jgi:hypothetical protein